MFTSNKHTNNVRSHHGNHWGHDDRGASPEREQSPELDDFDPELRGSVARNPSEVLTGTENESGRCADHDSSSPAPERQKTK